MAITQDSIFGKTLIDSVNSVFETAPKPLVPPLPPKPKTTFGMTHYTCLPSKTRAAEYECKKGYDPSLDDQRHHPNPVSQLLMADSLGIYHHKFTDQILKAEDKTVPYFACYSTKEGHTECVKGQFKNPFEEGRVKYVSVPSLMPSHEWYIRQRWPRVRIVDDYSTAPSDLGLNPTTQID